MNLVILFENDFIPDNKIVQLQGRRLDHILSVHKANEGDSLRVGLVNGKIGTGRITSLTAKSMEMEVELLHNPPPSVPVNLILAMPRPKALRRIIQHTTSIGIKKIYLTRTWRVEKSFFDSPALKDDNLFNDMILGLEQARDTILPEIHIKKLFKPFVEDEVSEIIKDTLAIAAHPTGKNDCPKNIQKPVTLAIGPEGGFLPYEIELLQKQGFETVNIGERILRVETAIPYILGRLY